MLVTYLRDYVEFRTLLLIFRDCRLVDPQRPIDVVIQGPIVPAHTRHAALLRIPFKLVDERAAIEHFLHLKIAGHD
jgi:hypothetical protein